MKPSQAFEFSLLCFHFKEKENETFLTTDCNFICTLIFPSFFHFEGLDVFGVLKGDFWLRTQEL